MCKTFLIDLTAGANTNAEARRQRETGLMKLLRKLLIEKFAERWNAKPISVAPNDLGDSAYWVRVFWFGKSTFFYTVGPYSHEVDDKYFIN